MIQNKWNGAKSFIMFQLCCTLCIHIVVAQQDTTLSADLKEVEIVGTTPIRGSGIERHRLPHKAQILKVSDVQSSGISNLTDALNQRLAGVHLNFATGNPLQPDLNYRGFTASPLLGLPQGIAVFQDGERLNEIFGNVVHWDLLPMYAVETVELLSGSNAAFGLNALGGALSLQTKTGFSARNKSMSVELGSFGRLHTIVEHGWNRGQKGWYISGDYFGETGWRDFSASQGGRLFGKMTHQSTKNIVHLSLGLASTRLRGNGPVPIELMEQRRASVFTHPDMTDNRSVRANVQWTHLINNDLRILSNFYTNLKFSNTFNGDESPYQVVDTGRYAGYLCHELEDDDDALEPVLSQHGNWIAWDKQVVGAINNRTATNQYGFGGTVQLFSERPLWERENRLMIGATFDGGLVNFGSNVEIASLTNSRGTIGTGLYDEEAEVELKFDALNANIHLVESWSATDKITVQATGQLQHSVIELKDQLGDDLNGKHIYTRFNPSLGLSWEVHPQIQVYGSYSVSARTPTPMELSCADPNAPCRLPNAFLSDPPLLQPVAQTFEIGGRGQKKSFSAELSFFRTRTKDDIYFISAGPSRNSGYFANIGNTLRQGIETSVQYRRASSYAYLQYTYLSATFESDFSINSPAHPEAVNGEIQVRRGNTIPLMPHHLLKIGTQHSFKFKNKQQFTTGLDAVWNSSQVFRGDEGNLLAPIEGYITANVYATWQFKKNWTIFARAENIWNQAYATFGMLGEADELPGFADFEEPFFMTPAPPLNIRLGLRWALTID